MIRNKTIVAFLLFFCGLTPINAQNIIQNIEKEIQLFTNYLYTDPDSAFYHINKAHQQSLAIENDSLMAKVTYNLGVYYYVNEDYLKSKNNLLNAIAFANKTKQNSVLASGYNILGLTNIATDKESEALKAYLKSYEISNKNNLFDTKSKVLINLGNLYLIQNDTTKSLSCYIQSIINSEKNNLNKQLAEACMSAAIVYVNKKNIKKGYELYKKALKIAEKEDNLNLQWQIHINLSDLYLEEKKNIESVYYHLQKAIKIQQLLNDETKLFYVYFNFGAYYSEKKQDSEAIKYYNKALKVSNNIPPDRLLALFKAIYEINFENKNYKTALQFNEKYNQLSDSIFTIEKNKSFTEIQTKYEVEKKNLKINLLSKENEIERTRKRIYLYLGLFITSGLVVMLLFYKNRIKLQKTILERETKIHLQEKEKLQQEQEIKRIMGVVQGQDEERNRLAKEIHDGVGGELAGIKLNLSQINHGIKNEKIATIIEQLATLFHELRNISHNLSSNFLKNKDFSKVLFELKREYEDRKEFVVEITIFPDNAFQIISEDTKHQIFRIIQELLANVSKHANAKNVSITITSYDEIINIIFEDDGRGFEENRKVGIGLKNIEERVMSLNGEMTIDTKLNIGSSIIIDLQKL